MSHPAACNHQVPKMQTPRLHFAACQGMPAGLRVSLKPSLAVDSEQQTLQAAQCSTTICQMARCRPNAALAVNHHGAPRPNGIVCTAVCCASTFVTGPCSALSAEH